MMLDRASHSQTNAIPEGNAGLAGRLLTSLSRYQFDFDSIKHYDPRVQAEIRDAVTDLRALAAPPTDELRVASPFCSLESDNPLERDQAVWNLVASGDSRACLTALMRSIERSPNESTAVSALLALQQVAASDLPSALHFLQEVGAANNSSVNLSEWARLVARELMAIHENNFGLLDTPVSNRPVVHTANQRFDLTLPLLFQCRARTRIGGVTYETRISPTWFSRIFGDAMACIRADTFRSNLVLEKSVADLHEDGSAHFEHFPFTGTTEQLSSSLFYHNYWSQIYRPFYTSGKVELVTEQAPVLRAVPMTFARLAVTAAYQKYAVDDVPLPESVRGVFFGYGHIDPMALVKRGANLSAGDFQISSRNNPQTGKPANTQYWGTFYGKLSDTDGNGNLQMNSRPVHCDQGGHLDYAGDGKMSPDPVAPLDWH